MFSVAKKILFLFIFVLIPFLSFAENQTFNTFIKGDLANIQTLLDGSETDDTIKISTKIKKSRLNIKLALSEQGKNYILLKGNGKFKTKNSFNKKTIPVRGIIYTDQKNPKLRLTIFGDGRLGTKVRAIYNLEASLKNTNTSEIAAHIERSPAETIETSENFTEKRVRSSAVYTEIELQIQTDWYWLDRFLEQHEAKAAEIVNAAEAIFERDLGITFRVVRYKNHPNQNYTEWPNSIQIAGPEAIQTWLIAKVQDGQAADIAHMFIGQEIPNVYGSHTEGFPNEFGSVCTFDGNANSFSVYQGTPQDIILFAHEIGHLLGAKDNTVTPASIMYPTGTVSAQASFNSRSSFEIDQYFGKIGDFEQCLNIDNGRGHVTPADLGWETPDAIFNPQSTNTDTGGGDNGGNTGGGNTGAGVGGGTGSSGGSGGTTVIVKNPALKLSKRKVKKKRYLIAFSFEHGSSNAINNAPIHLYYKKKKKKGRLNLVAIGRTNSAGQLTFQIKKKGFYKITYGTNTSISSKLVKYRWRRKNNKKKKK